MGKKLLSHQVAFSCRDTDRGILGYAVVSFQGRPLRIFRVLQITQLLLI
ncbi:hypothetical protein HUN01_01760 (plasmid) [Nostoc edaphicum CCNP1411]|uniref:Uncharacterized protein n=1 Tax=Nostoc edaphicum CCNP1411 TaxID=1472755 RepID=A0A7D7LDL6_9NOSO|nr:hypothetical protein [Nostoc edaphicum]QMS86367.1 hypothetical protein HUN01_01760 [Nostoc edaphicum CCNP1411]